MLSAASFTAEMRFIGLIWMVCQAHTCGITNTSELLCWGSPIDETLAVSCHDDFFVFFKWQYCSCQAVADAQKFGECFVSCIQLLADLFMIWVPHHEGAIWEHLESSQCWHCCHLRCEQHRKHLLLGQTRQWKPQLDASYAH